MSGGDQLSENQPAESDVYVNVVHMDGMAIIRAVLDECMRDPHEFVSNERMR